MHGCATTSSNLIRIKLKPFSSQHLLCPLVTVYYRQSWSVHTKLFSDKVRNLGFILDSNLTMKQHAIKICQTAYYKLKYISSICRYLTEEAAKQLVTSCGLSRLDYCNSLLTGTPSCVIQPMQKVQNTAARLILRALHHQNCTDLLRAKYRTACMCYNAITGSVPYRLSTAKPMFFALSHASALTSGTISPETPGILSLPLIANSRHFS